MIVPRTSPSAIKTLVSCNVFVHPAARTRSANVEPNDRLRQVPEQAILRAKAT